MSEQTLSLTYDQALDGLRAAVADRGAGFVYQDAYAVGARSCQNFIAGQPACIAGYVYSLYGIRPEGRWAYSGVSNLSSVGLLGVDDRTKTLLTRAQQEQDDGRTWGEALRRAIESTSP